MGSFTEDCPYCHVSKRLLTASHAERDALSNKVEFLREVSNELTQERDELQRQLKAARQVEADLGRELSEARGAQAPELESLRESYSNVVSQHGRALAERDEALTQLARLEVREREATDELRRWQDSHAGACESLKKALVERDAALAELAKARQGGKDYAQSYFDAILAERDKAYRERDEARKLVANCKTRMQDLEQRVEAAEKVATEARKGRDFVRDDRDEILKALSKLVEKYSP